MNRAFQTVFAVCFALIAAAVLLQDFTALALVAVVAVVLFCRRCTVPRFTLWLFVGTAALGLLGVLILRPPVESDFMLILRSAQELLSGSTAFQYSDYFSLWAYQTGWVLWDAAWLAVWNSPLCLALVNAFLTAGIVTLIYRILRQFVSPAAAQAGGLLLAFLPFFFLLPTLLTNQIPSAFFLVLAVWLALGGDTKHLAFWRYPLAGLALQLGNLLRPEGIILLVALAAVAFFRCLEHRHWKAIRGVLCAFLALVAVYLAVGFGAGAAVKAAGLNESGLANNNSLWKFVCGLNADTAGGYSQSDWDTIAATFENGKVTQATIALEKELIAQRLGVGPAALGKLAFSKANTLWNECPLFWVTGHLTTEPARQVAGHLADFDRGLLSVAFLLSLLGLAASLRRKDGLRAGALMFWFVPFVATCALLLIEVQSRYSYLPTLFLVPSAAFGVEFLLERFAPKGASHD